MFFLIPIWIVIFLITIIIPNGSQVLNGATILLWCVTALYIFRKQSSFGIISLSMIISYTATSIICAYAETGVFFSEAGIISYPTGATYRNLSLCAVILIFSYLSFSAFKRTKYLTASLSSSLNKHILTLVSLLSISCSFILIGINLKYGHPNDYNADRFFYWANVAPKWGEYINFLSTQLAIFLGLAYAIRNKKMYIAIFLLSLTSQYLVGEKFTGIYASSIMFIIPVFVMRNIDLSKIALKPKTIIIASALFAVLVLIMLMSYNSISRGTGGDSLLVNRVVLQSQMWWTVDNISHNGNALGNISTNLLGFGVDKHNTGIFYLMKQVARPDVYEWFVEKGINWTMAGPVNLIYFFGYGMAILPAAILGAIFGFSSFILYRAIMLKDVILVFLSIKLFNAVWQSMMMGNLYFLFTYKIMIVLGAFLFYVISSKIATKNNIYFSETH